MLEVLARIPGRPKVASKYVETDVARATVLLRGFHGHLCGFEEESGLEEALFWSDFAISDLISDLHSVLSGDPILIPEC